MNDVLKVAQEMRERKVNNGSNTSSTLCAWAERLEAVQHAIARLREPAGVGGEDWRPIATVPRDGTQVTVWMPDGTSTSARYGPESEPQATHWTLLRGPDAAPQPPAEAQGRLGSPVTDAMVGAIGSRLYIYWSDVSKSCRDKYRENVRAALVDALALQPPAEAQAQGGRELSDDIINALDDLDNAADTLRATGNPAMSERIRGARNVLRAAIFRTAPPSAPAVQGGGDVCGFCGGLCDHPDLHRLEADDNPYEIGTLAWITYERHLRNRRTAPPSAPVGVEAISRNEFMGWCSRWFGVDSDEAHLRRAADSLLALAQQPAAVDKAAELERFKEWAQEAGTYHTSGYNPHDDLWRAWQAALAQQPAAVDGAMAEAALRAWFETEDWRGLLTGIERADRCIERMRAALTAALAQPQGGA